MLEDFAAGKINLSVEALQALTKLFHSSAVCDEESGLLRSLAPEAKPMGIALERPTIRRRPGHGPKAAHHGIATVAAGQTANVSRLGALIEVITRPACCRGRSARTKTFPTILIA
jgi:hypothetical protein